MSSVRRKMSNKNYGILMMILNALVMSIMYSVKKQLVLDLHPTQIAFMYKFCILLMVLAWCSFGGLKKNLKTTKIGIHASRGAFSIMGTICFLYGIKHVSTTDAAAITFLENIIVVVIGLLYFKEKFNYSKLLLVVFGVTGMMLVIKPGFQEFNIHYIYLLLALMFWAFNNISIKVLGRTEHSRAQIFYVTLFSCLLTLPLTIAHWEPISLQSCKYILILAVLYLVHLVAIFKAFKFADFSIVMPFDYTRLIFTGILGYFILNEVPDIYKVFGYILITTGGLVMLSHEARIARRKRRSKKLKDQLVSVVNPPIGSDK